MIDTRELITLKATGIPTSIEQYQLGLDAAFNAGKVYRTRPPAPDCRTCKNFYWSQFTEDYQCHFLREGGACVNGDKHIAVPALVLWRTKCN
jgi:hypothetical protein